MNNQFYPQYNNQYQTQYPIRTNNNINWVQGIEGAKAFQLMPNSTTMMLDSENEGIFYIKVSDNVGMCTLRTFKYEEITNFCKKQENDVDMSQYITRDELQSILDKRLNRGNNNGKQSIQSTKPTITE